MIEASLACYFWSAIEDFLVQFHNFERSLAAETATTCLRQLPTPAGEHFGGLCADHMIYHAEPWYIACNLAQQDLSLSQYQREYRNVLRRNKPAYRSVQLPEKSRPVDAISIAGARIGGMERRNFALRLLPSLHKAAVRIAQRENCSMNHLINLALAEKIAVLEAGYWGERKKAAGANPRADVLKRLAGNAPPSEGNEID